MADARGPATLAIVNPKAGGAMHDVFRRYEHAILEHVERLDVAFTEGPGHATTLARDAVRRGVPQILVAGGDGTVSEVAHGFFEEDGTPAGQGSRLALLTGGTGGDLRRTLEIATMKDALLALSGETTRRIDVGRITCWSDEHDASITRVFVNIASCGMGGLVDRHVHAFSAIAGRYAYAAATARVLLTWKNKTVGLVGEGPDGPWRYDGPIAVVAVANGRYFGGGMKIAPGARLDDGQFQVTVLGDVRRRDVLTLTPKIFEGSHLDHPQVETFTAHRVEARSDDLVWLDVDGEPLGRLPATFEILPAALELAVP